MKNLGKTATDTTSGFTGTVTGIWYRLHGPTVIMIQSKDSENKKAKERWFTIDCMEIDGYEGPADDQEQTDRQG